MLNVLYAIMKHILRNKYFQWHIYLSQRYIYIPLRAYLIRFLCIAIILHVLSYIEIESSRY